MAYDKAKAHEYYVNYTKKGLKKGRKKGRKKGTTSTTTSTAFLGVSAQGFNDEGRLQVALVREKLKKEMKAKLANAKTDEERQKIRIEYSRKAQEEINKLKNDPKYAKPKATKKTSTKGTSSSAKSSSSGTSKSSGSSSSSTKTTTKATAKTTKPTMSAQMKKAITDMKSKVEEILSSGKIDQLSESEKTDLKNQLQGMIQRIYKLYKA